MGSQQWPDPDAADPFAPPPPGSTPAVPRPGSTPAAPPPPYGSPPPGYPPAYGTPPPGYPPYGYAPTTRTSGFAVASLVLSLVWVFWIGSILAVVFGHLALSEIKRDPRTQGKGLAVAGLVLGYLGIAFLALVIVAAIASGGAVEHGPGVTATVSAVTP